MQKVTKANLPSGSRGRLPARTGAVRVVGSSACTCCVMEYNARPSNNVGSAYVLKSLRQIVATDLYRHEGATGAKIFWRHFCWTPGFRYVFFLRLYHWLRDDTRWGRFGFRQFTALLIRRYTFKYGISISPDTKIGKGFY